MEEGSGMLVLTRGEGERIDIGEEVTVTVVKVRGKKVCLGINAPRGIRVDRQEVRMRMTVRETAKYT